MVSECNSGYTLDDTIRALMTDRRLFFRMCVAGAFFYCSYAMCRSPVLPLFARELGAGPALIGVIVGTSTITGIFLKYPAGILSDIWGRRPMLLAASGVFGFMPFAYPALSSLSALAATRTLHGSATAIFSPVGSAAASDIAPMRSRGRWLATMSSLQGLGQAIAPVLAGYLLATSGFGRVFVVSGVVGVLGLVTLASAQWPERTLASRPGFIAVARGVLTDRRILTVSLAQASQFFLNGVVAAFLPLYAADVTGLGGLGIGVIVALQTAATLLSRPLFGMVSDRVGRRPLILCGLLTCTGCVFLISLTSRPWQLGAAALVYGSGLAVTTSATAAQVTDLTRDARYGASHGIFGTIYDIGDAFGPMAAGVLVATVGLADAFRVMAAITLVLTIAFWQLSGSWRPSTG
jgi:DHA1 family multidrug resistance protein-like MFS transporter